MTAFDYGVIVIVLASLALGLWRGLIGEVLALLAWVLAALAAWQFGPEIGVLITAIADPGLRVLAGYAVVFVGVLIVLALVRLAVRGLLKALGLTAVDRLLGVVFRCCARFVDRVDSGGCRWHDLGAETGTLVGEAQLAPPLETAVLAASPGCRRKRQNEFDSGSKLK